MSNTIIGMVKNSPIPSLADSLGAVFSGLPHLPKGFKDFLVMIFPWASGFVGLMSLFSVLILTPSLFAVNSAVMYYGAPNSLTMPMSYVFFSMICLALVGVLYLASFSDLKNKNYDGWLGLFAGNLVSLFYLVVPFVLFPLYAGSIFSTALELVIGFYVFFELRPVYQGKSTAKKK